MWSEVGRAFVSGSRNLYGFRNRTQAATEETG